MDNCVEMSEHDFFEFIAEASIFEDRGCGWHSGWDDSFDDVADASYNQIHIRFVKDGKRPYHILTLHNNCVTLWDKDIDEHFITHIAPTAELKHSDCFEDTKLMHRFCAKAEEASKCGTLLADFLTQEVFV